MKITCPECYFSRNVSEDKIPAPSFNVTCPRCMFRFRIERSKHDEQEIENNEQQNIEPSVSEEARRAVELINTKPNTTSKFDEQKEEARKAFESFIKKTLAEKEAQQKAAQSYEQNTYIPFEIDNPWDDPEKTGYFSSFYQTCMHVLFNAPRFFAGLTPESGYIRALIFYIIVTILQITFERFWGGVISSALAPMIADDPQLQIVLTLLTPQMSYLLSVLMGAALSVVEITIFSALFFLAFRIIAPKNANYTLIVQIIAYSSAPVLLCVVPAIGSVVGFVWAMACAAIGYRYALNLSWPQVLTAFVPIYLIGIMIALQFIPL